MFIHNGNVSVLVVTSVAAEKEAVLCGLGECEGVDVMEVGVGAVTAAIRTAIALMQKPYGLVISAGIGGGFGDRAEVGALAIADAVVAADLGAESPDGFLPLDQLGWGKTRYTVTMELVDTLATRCRAKLPVSIGSILTLSTVTGTEETAQELLKRESNAVAEAMEGFGVAQAAMMQGVPMMEMRAISNRIGLRDRNAWKIHEALTVLRQASTQLKEVWG